MIAPVFIVTLALMLALVSAATPLAADVTVQKSTKTKKAIPKGLQMMHERMFGASKVPNPVMNHMMTVHGKDQAAASAKAASTKSLPTLETDSVKKNMKSAAKKDFEAQWTEADDVDVLNAEVGDVLHYNFYPHDDHCHEDDLIGRMSYKSGVCAKIPSRGHSFKLHGHKNNINDQTSGAGPSFEIDYDYYDDLDCTNGVTSHRMSTGAAVDECKAFGYYQPDDKNGGADEDDQFGNFVNGTAYPSEDRISNSQRHSFGIFPTPDEFLEFIKSGEFNQPMSRPEPAGAFQVSTDTSIVDGVEDSYTMYSLATAGACTGSNNNDESCKDAQKQAVMAQTWGNVKFNDCHYLYTVGDDDFYKNNGAPIYHNIVCDETRGPVYYEYHDAQCRKIFKHPDGSLARGLSFNEYFGRRGYFYIDLFNSYKFDDESGTVDDDDDDGDFVPLNDVWTCKTAKKSFYPIMVALVVGFVVVLPATVFVFYMLNKRFGWSLGTALKRAFNAGDAEQSSDEGKSVELAPVNNA